MSNAPADSNLEAMQDPSALADGQKQRGADLSRSGHSDAIHPNPAIAERLQRIYGLNRETINLRLERSPYNVLLERLGNPHLNLPSIIHVAGTNGKGSTLAFTRAMLEAAGYRVHVYTSPHLHVFNERITLGGRPVSDDILADALDRTDLANGDNPVTFFEYTTALAFDLFSRHRAEADILLLEVGMGGRLDCTNIIESPLCTAITKIGFDHMEYLGDTAAKIAFEKAGIMKRGAPCVIGMQEYDSATKTVFEDVARQNECSLHYAPLAPAEMILGLAGAHQYENAGTALAIVDILNARGYAIDDDSKRRGLAQAKWQGRLERVTSGRFYQALQKYFGHDAPKVYIDGGHNTSAAKALKATLAQWRSSASESPVHLFLGMGYDKDVNGFLDIVAPYIDGLYLLDVKGGLHPQSAQDLYDRLALKYQAKAQLWHEEAPNAHSTALHAPTILICGSLFLYQKL